MKISVLGLGIIGAIWAQHFQNDGLKTAVWNRTPRPEFSGYVATIEEAATGADFIFVIVSDPLAVESVLNRALPVLKPNAVVVQSATISPAWSKTFAARVQEAGARFLEAPFTGSQPAALTRECVFYLGVEEAALVEDARPVLERISKAQIVVGDVGSASALKLAMNMNIAGVSHALSESLHFARSSGLSDETFFQALAFNVSKSGVSDLKKTKLETGDFSPQFSLKHMSKDLRLALQTADENGAQLPMLGKLRELYELGLENGWGDDDFIGLVRILDAQG